VKNPQMLRRAREFARQGLVRDPSRHLITGEGPWHQEVHSFGLNYRLPDVLAALGSRQLDRLDGFKVRRAEIKAEYDSHLVATATVDIPVQRSYVDPVWHLYPLRVAASARRRVFEQLRADGIGVQVNYLPAHRHPVFEELGLVAGMCPRAEDFYAREISLPMFQGLDDETLTRVVLAVELAVASQ